MKILFGMLHPGYVRNYESTIRLLVERGHVVQLAFNRPAKQGEDRIAERLIQELPEVSAADLPKRKDPWASIALLLRYVIDYVRFLDPRFSGAPRLRQRMGARLRGPLVMLRRFPHLPKVLVRSLVRALMLLERAIPSSRHVDRYLTHIAPDIVLVTPLVNAGSAQVDLLKSAQSLGIRSGVCVASWDNLTNKGLFRIRPDRVFVWNEFQKKEAVEFDLVAPETVVITGAQRFDEWFERKPSTTREQFYRKVGLDVARPFVLYLCSSSFIAASELEIQFVRTWIEKIRSAGDPRLERLGILVRPHPQNVGVWANQDFSEVPNVAVWPPRGENPTSERAKADYFDSLFHAAAAVGVNTSALIEAGIVGRPVLTIEAPEFEGAQQGTIHYHYLVNVAGGLLSVAADLTRHVQQLADALSGASAYGDSRKQFVQEFIRPLGLDKAGTPVLVQAIEDLGAIARPLPKAVPALLLPLQLLLRVAAAFVPEFEPNDDGPLATGRLRPSVLKRIAGRIGRVPVRARRLLRAVTRFVGASAAERRQRVRQLLGDRTLPRSGRNGSTTRTDMNSVDLEVAAFAKLAFRAVSRADRPIIVGPWLSEVGFEILYWIPYLNWLTERYRVDHQRLIILSRGGARLWYQHLTRNYVDIFDLVTPERFRSENEHRWATEGGQKHMRSGKFDHELVTAAQKRLQLSLVDTLHPSLMYGLFRQLWRERQSVRVLAKYARFFPWEAPPPIPELGKLPDEYVAARFYHSACFPATERNRAFIIDFLRNLASRTNVVLLNTGLRLDDHAEPELFDLPNVHRVDHLITPANNLEIQTRVIAGARAFYGTYGGFCYLAPQYGVPAIGLYSNPTQFLPIHLDVANRVFRAYPAGSFTAMNVETLKSVSLAMAAWPVESESQDTARTPAGPPPPLSSADARSTTLSEGADASEVRLDAP